MPDAAKCCADHALAWAYTPVCWPHWPIGATPGTLGRYGEGPKRGGGAGGGKGVFVCVGGGREGSGAAVVTRMAVSACAL
eukprot:360479-Chlamydomonas_euryale.AAC.10